MASRISQMRNAMPQTMRQPSQSQTQLNESIERTKALMQQMHGMPNQEAVITTLLQNNPQLQSLIPLLRNGNNLEGIARQMAQMGGFDINQIINQLQGGV